MEEVPDPCRDLHTVQREEGGGRGQDTGSVVEHRSVRDRVQWRISRRSVRHSSLL